MFIKHSLSIHNSQHMFYNGRKIQICTNMYKQLKRSILANLITDMQYMGSHVN